MKQEERPAAIVQETDPIERWEEYWLAMAFAASRKSKDPRCRVGAVIVRDNILLSTGFNGLARNVYDDPSVLDEVDEKLKWICHAEQNAILNAARLGVALGDATIYVTKFPCLACCISIIQAGVCEIYTQDSKYWNDDPLDGEAVDDPHSRKQEMLRQAGIVVRAPYHPDFQPRRIGPLQTNRTDADASAPAVPEPRPSDRKPPRRADLRAEILDDTSGVPTEEKDAK
jgi:dCMP deaminase